MSVLLLGVCLGAGALVADTRMGLIFIAMLSLTMTVMLLTAVWGTSGILVLLFGVAALIPVVAGAQGTGGVGSSNTVPISTIYGYDAATVRTLFIVLLTLLAVVYAASHNELRLPVRLRAITAGLAAMALLGLVATAFTAGNASEYIKDASQAAGQPLVYLSLFVTLSGIFQSEPTARSQLVTAWCFAVVIEAVIVAIQLATGAAYDPLRGLTRAGGTMGPDFLGVFAVLGIFGGAYLWRIGGVSSSKKWIGGAATCAGTFMLVVSVSRGSLIGLALAVVSLLLGSRDRGGLGRLATTVMVALLAGVSLYAARGLWEARLNASSTGTFDRPATWISGLRIARDNPLVGVGSSNLATVVISNPRYSDTPYGVSLSNPSDAWLFVADSDGVPYGVLLGVISVIFVSVIVRARKSSSARLLVAGLLAAGVVFVINNLFTHPEIMLYVILAAMIVLSDEHARAVGLPQRPITDQQTYTAVLDSDS